ncbi:MAG TPA: hypothetical protein VHK28_09710 [Candidatus Limnocylindria bacterium]|nr:hypothetical protein [Candidatus Limnocylindria bacterium]
MNADAVSALRGLAWAVISFAFFLVALFATLPILAAVRLFIATDHLVEMAEWSVVWGALSLCGVLVAGRIAFGDWLRVGLPGFLVGGTGIALSAIVHVVLQQWAITRFGYFDADFVGWWTGGLFAVLIGLATGAFGVFVAPRGAAAWPLIAVLLGFAGVLLVLLGNLSGLADGIAPESWPLAIWLGISALYAAGAATSATVRVRAAR